MRLFLKTGPGSHAALVATGANARRIDAPPLEGGVFDSEALWEQVHHHMCQGYRVLIVRGSDATTAAGLEGMRLKVGLGAASAAEVNCAFIAGFWV